MHVHFLTEKVVHKRRSLLGIRRDHSQPHLKSNQMSERFIPPSVLSSY